MSEDVNSLLAGYVERVLRARVYDVAIETPLDKAERLSARLGCQILFKREDLQPVFSFKLRGAYNKLHHLNDAERQNGVIASSAGNHAQGVALAARKMGIDATIVMPTTTPSIKVDAVRVLGAKVLLSGDTYDDAQAAAHEYARENQSTFIHPFDDPEVIAGQGTIALELIRQLHNPPQAILIPIGGGGLIAGIATVFKHLFPQVAIVGVEPEEAASMTAALDEGAPVSLDQVGIFADGVAVRRVGDETFRVGRHVIDEIVQVNTDEICAATKDIFEDSRVVVEPAGALAVAGLKKYVQKRNVEGQSFVTLNCGANVNFDRLRHIAERAELGEEREAIFAVEIPEQPGAFRTFCETLGDRAVTEFNYRFAAGNVARIFVGISLTKGSEEARAVMASLRAAGYVVTDLTDNELAKVHIRHLVGGPAVSLGDERLFRFVFPERPGALLAFLTAVGDRWNISLFHYRNHGSDSGRVLVGVQIPDTEVAEFRQHANGLGYTYFEETENPAYQLFLGERTS